MQPGVFIARAALSYGKGGGKQQMALPSDLLAAVSEGRAVLFLGAGASKGAKDKEGHDIPLAQGLADELADKFVGKDYVGAEFRAAYDLACSQRDVRTVQRYVYERLLPFQPAQFHLLIPEFAWAGLLTTNYDLIVEAAYGLASRPVQHLVPNVRDGDGATDSLDHRSVLLVKLHGCMKQHNEVHPPMVASTEQLIAFREGRKGQFDTFLEWGKTKSIIFVGYRFLDPNLRALFDEIIREGDNRPRHYIIGPDLKSAEAQYWSDRRVTAISMTFEQLLTELDSAIPKGKRDLGLLASHTLHASSFSRFITVPGQRESDELKSYLASMIDHVSVDLIATKETPGKFYRGFDLGWYPIQSDLDVPRRITFEVITEQIIPTPPAERAKIVIIKGHAGSGKTVSLRRIAWEAAKSYGKLCFFVGRDGSIALRQFEEIFSLSNLPIFLFVDDIAEHRSDILELIELARRRRAALRIIATESFNLWNTYCAELEPHVSEQYEMRYLSEAEINKLIEKLDQYGSLGHLKRLQPDQRVHELKFIYGRQLLVALLEATHGIPLVEIIAGEYSSINPPEAKLLYLDICSLHRFGPPVRAGLISRLHNLTFDQFREKLFKPLEQIVRLRTDTKSGDFVYEARHSQIAHHVYEVALKTQDARFDNLVHILTKLNPNFSYDLEVLSHLIRAANVEAIVSDPVKGRQIYDVALAAAGRLPFILHQRGLYEMHIAGQLAQLRNAEEWLEEACEREPYNRSMKHSLAELDLKRSRLATDPLERAAWRKSAADRAAELVKGSINSYPHSTLIKAAVDEVRDALAAVEQAENETTIRVLEDSIAKAEDTLRKSIQQLPNDPMLLSLEGELSNALSQAERTESAFKRAFKANPRSVLIARRLARVQRSKEQYDDAIATLRIALDANPSSGELQFELATTLINSAPDADQTRVEDILYHLRRSFSPGDKNYQAQFLYARELCIAGKYDDARSLFAVLSETKTSYEQKREVRNYVLDASGARRLLHGHITALRPTFGFIQSHDPPLSAYFELDRIAVAPDRITEGAPVEFELGFNLRGPVATAVRLTS